ncbi:MULTISPECIES: hypothetical protein [unclassified Kocuria]|uniref:hypothetical protein n=1 Tax=unclassified Kocuria TaxID=2649579 RepID=UPI0037BF1550
MTEAGTSGLPVASISASLTDGAVPPNSDVETLQVIAKPAKRTLVGNMAGKVAEIVASGRT